MQRNYVHVIVGISSRLGHYGQRLHNNIIMYTDMLYTELVAVCIIAWINSQNLWM